MSRALSAVPDPSIRIVMEQAGVLTSAVAGRSRPRLRASCVPAAGLDADTRDAAWTLFAAAYDGADRTRFEHDLADKQYVILLRDPATRALRGFSTVAVRDRVVFSGDTVIDPAFWGAKALQRAFSMLLLRQKLSDPTRPLYWFLISKGYKTYLMLARACPRATPRYDRAPEPALQRLLDRLASERFGTSYDPATGLVRHIEPRESVRAGLCPLDDALLANPHVAFFVARNPGHARGDELACLAEIRLHDPLRRIVRR